MERSIEASRWNTRGWTLQERRLSTRMIHFCDDRIMFECRSCMETEDVGVDLGSGLMRSKEQIVESGPELYNQWTEMLKSYALRALSVAEAMAPGLDMEYLPFAGM